MKPNEMKTITGLILWFTAVQQYFVKADCGADSRCDQWSPCCSEHGFCGNDYGFCGIGCKSEGVYDDGNSYCLLPPACQSATYLFDDETRILSRENYTGDYRAVDWAATGKYSLVNGVAEISMNKGSGGSRFTSTRYVHFGKITAKLRAAKGTGVVTSFITMAENADEIDWEWIGNDLNNVQSNYYYQGLLDYTKGVKHPISDITTFHEYTIDWSPDQIVWSIDSKVVRTLKKVETLDNGVYKFPTAPSRIEIGLWDGGSGKQGTQDWAGGIINWDESPQGFKTYLQSVQVECRGDPTSSDSDFTKIFNGKPNHTISSGQADFYNNNPYSHNTRLMNGNNSHANLAHPPLHPLTILLLISSLPLFFI